jgi:uncharacterized membrane protein HdeD (DUF308 family)
MSTIDQQVKDVRSDYTRLRWAVGLSGALSIAVGVVILLWPGISLFALTILFGAYITASGVVGLIAAIRGNFVKQHRGWLAAGSILSIVAGVLVLVWPNIGALTLLFIIGAYAIVIGIVMAGGAFWLPLNGGDKGLLLFGGIVALLFGVVMFANPNDGALVLLALIAAYSLVVGVSEVVVAIGGERLVTARAKRAIDQAERQLRKNEPQTAA